MATSIENTLETTIADLLKSKRPQALTEVYHSMQAKDSKEQLSNPGQQLARFPCMLLSHRCTYSKEDLEIHCGFGRAIGRWHG